MSYREHSTRAMHHYQITGLLPASRREAVPSIGGVPMSGRKDQRAGKAKEWQGKVTGDAGKESEGQVQNAIGKLEKRAEDAVDSARGAAKAVSDKRPRR